MLSAPVHFLFITCLGILTSIVPSVANPLPMPLALMMADYSPGLNALNRSIANIGSRRDAVRSYSPFGRPRDVASLSDLLNYYDAASSHANDLSQSCLLFILAPY